MQKVEGIRWLSFDQLSLNELYSILKLRSDIFVVEQVCAYPDLDNLDQKSYHGLLYQADQLTGYIRIYQTDSGQWTFGRVVVNPAYRKQKLGTYLVKGALDKIKELHKNATIIIGAQAHLESYYQQFGFITLSEPYDDYGILHVDMRLESS
ncbi:MAG: GNAT family N-acetyltransferase [Gammaproteobacteria bacterium]|nr:MAG: GNAT family N-acetyltransferase [Gammaproteobacteria bacterium]UTW42962.1 GNAT family N-acetyltransferase [bacterium SCSIO 12844]